MSESDTDSEPVHAEAVSQVNTMPAPTDTADISTDLIVKSDIETVNAESVSQVDTMPAPDLTNTADLVPDIIVESELEPVRVEIVSPVDTMSPKQKYEDAELTVQDKRDTDDELEPEVVVIINQLRSNSTLKVEAFIQQHIGLRAILDTAAQVTILSDKVFNQLKQKPPTLREMILQTAGRELKIKGRVVGPLEIKVGQMSYLEEVVIAPIEDEMLLGLDFMLKHGVSINMQGQSFVLGKKRSLWLLKHQTKKSYRGSPLRNGQ